MSGLRAILRRNPFQDRGLDRDKTQSTSIVVAFACLTSAEAEKLRGLRNVWRHSFISYPLARYKSRALTHPRAWAAVLAHGGTCISGQVADNRTKRRHA